MTTITIDIDDLLRILELANYTTLQRSGEDIGVFARSCWLLLAAGMSEREITQRIAPLPRSKEPQP